MSEFVEDCRQCCNWLLRAGVVTVERCAGTDLYELGCLLQDGVILCQLSNLLHPHSINPNEYSQCFQMPQCLCLKNIRLFLQACKTVFNMKENDLFEPAHLYEMKDLAKVIHTLSQISQTEACQKLNLQAFFVQQLPCRHDKGTLKSFRSHYNDQTYGSKASHDRMEGDVYGRLVDFQPAVTPRDPEPVTKRELCIRELVVTEQNFIEALNMIKQYFMEPLKTVIQPQEFKTIFSFIELLHEIHSGFYVDLKKACLNSSNNISNNPISNNINNNSLNNNNNEAELHVNLSIPDCFIMWKERFLIYGSFCSNLLKAQNLLDDLCACNPAIHSQVEKSQFEANEGRFKLRDLLSVPMQRVLKYHLFLKELIKNTERGHHDRKSLERALEEIQDLSLYVNEVKRDNDALLLLDEISRSIIGYQMPENISLKDYGRLINDGEVKVKAHSDHKTKNRYAFLFDKVLLFCKLKGDSLYSFKSALIVSSFEIEDQVNTKEKEKNFGWTFVLGECSMKNAYTIGCRSLELKKKWISAIKTAQDNILPAHAHNSLHSFEMASFNNVSICDICRKLLKGLFYQGYLCQKSKMVVHKECIERAKDMPGPPKPPPKSKTPSEHSNNDRFSASSTPRTPNRLPHSLEPSQQNNATRTKKADSPPTPSSFLNNSTSLMSYPWFVGCMSRDEASRRLERCLDGTFLLRTSMSNSRRGEFALSIKYGRDMPVKHIKVQTNVEGLFFIADCKIFKNIPEMVTYYEKNSLQPSFSEVPTTLLHPFKLSSSLLATAQDHSSSVLGYCNVVYDYKATEANQLGLKKGDRVAVVSKEGGWWKGVLNGQIGYFPSSFVLESEEDNNLIKFNEPLP